MKKKPYSQIASGSTTEKKPNTLQSPQPGLHSSTKYRWIPKSILQAQGYYNGQRKIWLPKRPNPMLESQTSSKPNSQTNTSKVVTTSSLQKPVKQVWLPKPTQPKSPTIKYQAQLFQRIFLHQLPQAAAVCIIMALPLRPHICA